MIGIRIGFQHQLWDFVNVGLNLLNFETTFFTFIYLFIYSLLYVFKNLNIFYNLSLAWACVNPPIPPPHANLILHYVTDTIVQFGENVSYELMEDHYFHETMDITNFNLTCLTDGTWTDPLPWRIGIHVNGKFKEVNDRQVFINIKIPFSNRTILS